MVRNLRLKAALLTDSNLYQLMNLSQLKTILTGVPQGFILGPLLFFFIYINNLPFCTNLFMIRFTDDASCTTLHTNCFDWLIPNSVNYALTSILINFIFFLIKLNILSYTNCHAEPDFRIFINKKMKIKIF